MPEYRIATAPDTFGYDIPKINEYPPQHILSNAKCFENAITYIVTKLEALSDEQASAYDDYNEKPVPASLEVDIRKASEGLYDSYLAIREALDRLEHLLEPEGDHIRRLYDGIRMRTIRRYASVEVDQKNNVDN